MAIHNTIEIMRPNLVMFVGGFLAVIFGVFLIVALFGSNAKLAGLIVGFTLGLSLMVTGIGFMVKYDDPPFARPTGKKQLEVTFIDDEIPVNFLDKYEVIEQRGEIFVLEEK